ncbi:hypothetical protein COOONC_18610 [Cooperia oncophora]
MQGVAGRPSGDKESVLSSTPSEKAPKPKKEPIFTPTEPSEPEGLGRMPKSKPVVQRKEKEDVAPYSRPYFPYWTAQKFSTSKVESNTSPSGRVRGAKITTSEKSFWMPSGTGYTSSSRYSGPMTFGASIQDVKIVSQPEKEVGSSAAKAPPPRDAYELRRELERMRANEISIGMQGIIEDVKKRHKSEQVPPLPPITRFGVGSSDFEPFDFTVFFSAKSPTARLQRAKASVRSLHLLKRTPTPFRLSRLPLREKVFENEKQRLLT